VDVGADDLEPMADGLGNEHSVERVAVNGGKLADLERLRLAGSDRHVNAAAGMTRETEDVIIKLITQQQLTIGVGRLNGGALEDAAMFGVVEAIFGLAEAVPRRRFCGLR
jgi:hypothetical protein